jgi:hypothetical protein
LFACILLPGTLLGGASVGLVVLLVAGSGLALLLVCRVADDRHSGPDRR